jgi:hypothetical protein
MNTGMQDAFNLGWKLAMVVRQTCADHLLESYSPERSAIGDEVLKSAARLTTVGTLRNHLVQDIRNLVGHIALGFSPVKQAFADTMSETSIGYPATPLNGPALHAHLKARSRKRTPPRSRWRKRFESDRRARRLRAPIPREREARSLPKIPVACQD